MLRASSREREHSRNLRADAWIAVDRTLSIHGLGVVLHRSHPHPASGGFDIEALAVVPHRKT